MLKMYHLKSASGGTPDFWEDTWNEVDFDQSLRFCDVDPLRPLFERYARPGASMLEGGCGQGQYVVHNARRGVNVVGLDFAREALSRLRARGPQLKLCLGDVAALPFRDESFDVYYSGGVVEHFEGGAEQALSEARRVLRRDGVLLISVPYYSPLRRAVAASRGDWRFVSRASVDTPEERGERQFFQYAYTRREFERLLEAAGLRVISTQGYAIIWGLHDMPFAGRAMAAMGARGGGGSPVAQAEGGSASPVAAQGAQAAAHGVESGAHREAVMNGESTAHDGAATTTAATVAPSLLRRLVISEDERVPVAGLAVRALRWACANMMMYVCVRADGEETR